MLKRFIGYFTKSELLLWGLSAAFVLVSFFLFDRSNYLSLCASLIGVTYLIFNAKGNPVGQVLVIVFSLLYGAISYSFSYYGEMITYIGMTMPMAVTAAFYFILRAFHTANIIPSTLSVTTSFIAVYLTFRRDPFYALAYAANDIILIILWTMASLTDTKYISVVVCFLVFLVNDIYSFLEEPKGKIKAGDGVFAATLEDKKIPTLPKRIKSGYFVSW